MEPNANNETTKMETYQTNSYDNTEKTETSGNLVGSSSRTQHLDANEGRSIKIFMVADIEKAVDISNGGEILGEGELGVVYKCILDGEVVVIKILKGDQDTREFIREARILGELNHPNLVMLIGVCYENRALVFEYVKNKGNLRNYMEAKPTKLPWRLRIRIIYQMCSVLAYLHSRPQPLVHGELKPDNVLLDGNMNIKIADFGLYRFFPADMFREMFLIDIKGTGVYGHPVFRSGGELTVRSDIYSLAMTMLKIMTGKDPETVHKKIFAATRLSGEIFDLADDTAGDWRANAFKWLAINAEGSLIVSCHPELLEKSSLIDIKKLLEISLTHMKEMEAKLINRLGKLFINFTWNDEEKDADVSGEINYQPYADNEPTEMETSQAMLYDNIKKIEPSRNESGWISRTQNLDDFGRRSIKVFTVADIEKAVDISNGGKKIREEKFGIVYKCILDGEVVIIKILKGGQGTRDFITEAEFLRDLDHANLAKLIGVCYENHALVSEYVKNGSLGDYMDKYPAKLPWRLRARIICQISSALDYLHSRIEPVFHGELNPDNILLDGNMNVKLAYYEMCRFLPAGTTNKLSAEGRTDYIDPQFRAKGVPTVAGDFYSFGMIILRIVTGKNPMVVYREILELDRSKLMKLADDTAGDWNEKAFQLLTSHALQCLIVCFSTKKPSTRMEMEKMEKDMEKMDTELRGALGEYINFTWNDEEMDGKINFQSLPHGVGKPRKVRGCQVGPSIRESRSSRTAGIIVFSFKEIETATDGFSDAMEVGDQGEAYEKVYRAKLRGAEVTIQMTGLTKFMKDMDFVGQMDHRNLVKLIGACFKCHALVYEHLHNGSVEEYITKTPQLYTWQLRTRTVYQICSALVYLHNRPQPLVHGNVMPDNIFLDRRLNAKLGDLGGASELGQVSVDLESIKSIEYTLPEYKTSGYCDAYSFGVTVLRIMTGMHPSVIIGKMRTGKLILDLADGKAGDWPNYVVNFLANHAIRCCLPETIGFKIMEEMYVEFPMVLNYFDISMQYEAEEDKEMIVDLDELLELNIKLFDKVDIEIATENFSAKIGSGGFGTVYKGVHDNAEIAVKVLTANNDQYWKDEFSREVEILGKVKHENLVKLLGVCFDPISLVYEYMPNKSVEHCLYHTPGDLSWQRRIRIMYETCSILMCLHSEAIVHGDLKPDNILLDGNYHAKLADFGLSRRLTDREGSMVFIHTKVAKGTDYFIDPDYRSCGILTAACDIYSFGVTILRLLVTEGPSNITKKVIKACKNKTVMNLVDNKAGQWPEEVAMIAAYHGVTCCSRKRHDANILLEVSKGLKEILDANIFT